MDKLRKPSKRPLRFNLLERSAYAVLGICYALGFVYVCFFARRRWGPPPKNKLNLEFFRDKVQYWQTSALHTRPESIEFYKDFIGNILLYIPLPFLLFYALGVKTFSRLLLISIATSVSVETLQYVLNIGVADIDDVFLNSLGALIGILILFGLFRWIHQYDTALHTA